MKLDLDRYREDAAKLKPMQKRINALEDEVYASTRKAIRKAGSSKEFDESLDKERKARKAAELELEGKTRELRAHEDHELRARRLALEIEVACALFSFSYVRLFFA
jgi:hypothetical protein